VNDAKMQRKALMANNAFYNSLGDAPSAFPSADLVEKAALHAVRARKDYQRYVRDYFKWLDDGANPMDAETLRAYVQALRARYSGGSFSPILAAIKSGVRGAANMLCRAEEAAVVSEAFRAVKTPRRASAGVRRDYLLTSQEERAALASMSARDGLLLRFLLSTGARVSEALGIRLSTCKREGRTVNCPVMGKGGKTRELRVGMELFDSILGTFRGKTYLFETSTGKPLHRVYVSHRIRAAVERSVGKRFSPHGARHTFATRMIRETRKIQAVSEYLGHSSTSVTLSMYTHESLTDAELGIE
jgi:integrase/recombinase XerD